MRWFRKLTTTVVVVLFALSVSTVQAEERDTSIARSFIEGMGGVFFAAAWPTATFERIEIGQVERLPRGGWDANLVLHGTSAWDNPLHVRLVVTFRDGSVERMRWGKHNGLIPPGTVWSTVEDLLQEVNSQSPSTPPPTRQPAAAPLVSTDQITQTWNVTDACPDRAGLRVRFFDRTTTQQAWWRPGDGTSFEMTAGTTKSLRISVRPGIKVCYGAAPDKDGSTSYWGLGLDGKMDCESCCHTASTTPVSIKLTCAP